MRAEEQYIDLFGEHCQLIRSLSSSAMNAVRDEAFDDFKSKGLPTRKTERYKYTDIPALFAPTDYGLNLQRLNIPTSTKELFRCDIPNLTTRPFFVVNDTLYDLESNLSKNADSIGRKPMSLPEGVTICSLRNYPGSDGKSKTKISEIIDNHYALIAKTSDDGVTALNTTLAEDGLLIYIPRNTRVEDTIQVINLSHSAVDMMINRRVLIVAEEGSEAKILFCDHTADDKRFLTTEVMEAFIGAGANIEIYCMEETHYKNIRVSNTYVRQERDSRFVHHSLTLHNGTTRNRIDVTMRGEGAECILNGCATADRKQHVDNNTLIDHQAPHCESRELYKYVLDEEAVGAFAGRVLVREGAEKTVSKETNQNLLVTDTARMFTQPELEIYADDVKCAHGSTVGQLNDAALFYMQQRGISMKEARTLLQFAFVGEVIDLITLIPLRDRLRYLLDKRFRGELNKCVGCKMCS